VRIPIVFERGNRGTLNDMSGKTDPKRKTINIKKL
jgi:hypothetical protein